GGEVEWVLAETVARVEGGGMAVTERGLKIDRNPRPGWEGRRNPIHVAVLILMGINIVENLDLEELVATGRRLNRYEFAITFAPLPVEGGTGSPVNPLAIF